MFTYFSLTQRCATSLLAISMLLNSSNVFAETVTVNFRETEIDAVVETIAKITGGTFIIDPRVQGKMTIISPEPVEADLLYEIFLGALQVHGFQGVDDGAAIRILPLSRAINVPTNGKPGNEIVTEIVSLTYVSANELVPILKPLMSQGAHLGAHPASNQIIITDSAAQVRRLKDIVRDMDDPDKKDFEVLELSHTSASDIVTIAREMDILTGQSKIIEDTGSNRIIISGPRTTREHLKKLITSLDTQTADNSGIDVIYLDYSEAENIQPILEAMLKSKAFLSLSGESTAPQDTSSYTIQADKENNALIIAAPTGVTTAIRNIITKLDKPRSQVLIEAVIAEVSEDFARSISANIATAGHFGGVLSDFSGTLTNLLGVAVDGTDNVSSSDLASLAGADPTFGGGFYDEDKQQGLAAIIQAIKTDSRSSLLSTPSILTLENEEALISIGQEVPFQTGSFTTGTNGSSNPFTTIERQEVGTILRVKPQINEGDTIRLEVNQEVSGVTESATGTTVDVVTDKKVIETNVIVNNNEILVLGGLIDNNFSNVESRVPLLGDIPILGRLFRSSSRRSDTTMLMVFIRPTILRNAVDASKLTESKYRILQDRRTEFIEDNKYQKFIEPMPETLENVKSIDELLE